VYVPGSTSISTAVAPVRSNGRDGCDRSVGYGENQIPAPMPQARNANSIASVPLPTPTPWVTPTKAAKATSRPATSRLRI
jgi:hypothetical protein